jgi:hypothetical protein
MSVFLINIKRKSSEKDTLYIQKLCSHFRRNLRATQYLPRSCEGSSRLSVQVSQSCPFYT